MKSAQQFWMVYGENRGSPTHRHSSFASAEREAQRLARAHPDNRFFVLAACAGFVKSDLHEVEITPAYDDEMIPW